MVGNYCVAVFLVTVLVTACAKSGSLNIHDDVMCYPFKVHCKGSWVHFAHHVRHTMHSEKMAVPDILRYQKCQEIWYFDQTHFRLQKSMV